ncbi:hypothetical protein Rs2_26140 [Raphanus sativus]|uniref:Uncharacterized protein LOC108811557 isoform X1 n=1 Tax=Raphanus sativus TaxID=3726 RepID=A0A6J0JWL8_RAPSA|nr:uncharacterized protein LOC108811557 isoform X1 [Raphanus sativus]KAJ4886392.1 hypothetical protein Rs2_26140 [Raphanus sativus]
MGEDEKDAFYVVRKGDIIGVYRSLSECQQQAPSSVTDPPMSVYKGYGWPPQGAQELISSFGLKNALFSVNASHLKHDDSSSVFGKLIPCPLQQPSSSSSSYQGESLDKPPSQPKRLLKQMETDESSFFPSSHPQKHLKIENSGSGGMVPRPSTQRPILQNEDSCSIEFDGASKGNPGKAGAGAVLRSSHDNSVLFYLREGVGTATNNVAEYRALILGLKSALLKGFRNVRVQGDSMLVCMQVQDKWQTKHPKMAELCKQAKDLIKQFKSFQIQHIDREFNSVADAQANHAINLPEGQTKEIAGGC